MSRQEQPSEERPDDSDWDSQARQEYEDWCRDEWKQWTKRYSNEFDDIGEQA